MHLQLVEQEQAFLKQPSDRKRNRPFWRTGCIMWQCVYDAGGVMGTLVEAGYEPESAYFRCIHEMKLIVDPDF